MRALLALEDGSIFRGQSFGSTEPCGGEVVFNTAMSGYQEVLSDPSYFGQIVVFTSAHIGNYGIHTTDSESTGPVAVGAITREVCWSPRHPESLESLPSWLSRHGRFGLTGVDTRKLTLLVRSKGNLRGWFTTAEDPEDAVARARSLPRMRDVAAVPTVTTTQPYTWSGGQSRPLESARPVAGTASDAGAVDVAGGSAGKARPRVVVIDYGVKHNILRELEVRGCEVIVVPADASAELVDGLEPDGVLLSNGPGDPESLERAVPMVRHTLENHPTLAICLGHQLVGMALGCRILKLPFGHHGANHPVKDIVRGRVAITSQNHNYAIDGTVLPDGVEVTHLNLNDGTVQGLRHKQYRLWSLQFHPEASPGPHDARDVFDHFVENVKGNAGLAPGAGK
ncbi:MAG: glutamine-hydrolyzing carbamoyl-phosphate synthase small subunit [Candidatus Eisenbacteria bacterium]|uniref:Carbamoyl phosphate synthase small chain n=1 Tax=Eiseniibacteriota bacterium TaxID=2212470 RepID=A0A956LW12_UNCEI|nr:glutamine-hydrolyzing carbamoyl-phosphate synthase small subunit [Candidatus Eisenbacteria bacterium]